MATITSTGQWTRLSTDLTPLRDTAASGAGVAGNKIAVGTLPALNPNDLTGLPDELRQFLQLAAQGFGASFFDNAAPQSQGGAGTSQLNPLAAALLVRNMLNFYLERGFPGHDGIGTRG